MVKFDENNINIDNGYVFKKIEMTYNQLQYLRSLLSRDNVTCNRWFPSGTNAMRRISKYDAMKIIDEIKSKQPVNLIVD